MEEKVYILKFLPEKIKDFFLESGLEDIEEISDKFGFSEKISDELDIIQQDILFGYEQVDKILELIQTRLGLDVQIATKVALEMLQKRFLPLDSYLGAKAFSTYSQLGGDTNVINIQRIDAAGTVLDVRRRMSENEDFVKHAIEAADQPEKRLDMSGENLEDESEISEENKKEQQPAREETILDPSTELSPPPLAITKNQSKNTKTLQEKEDSKLEGLIGDIQFKDNLEVKPQKKEERPLKTIVEDNKRPIRKLRKKAESDKTVPPPAPPAPPPYKRPRKLKDHRYYQKYKKRQK